MSDRDGEELTPTQFRCSLCVAVVAQLLLAGCVVGATVQTYFAACVTGHPDAGAIAILQWCVVVWFAMLTWLIATR